MPGHYAHKIYWLYEESSESELPDIHFKHLNHIIFVKADILDNFSNSILEFCHITKHCQGVQWINQCETVITKYVIYVDVGSAIKNNENNGFHK
jgi:hypothetical protein